MQEKIISTPTEQILISLNIINNTLNKTAMMLITASFFFVFFIVLDAIVDSFLHYSKESSRLLLSPSICQKRGLDNYFSSPSLLSSSETDVENLLLKEGVSIEDRSSLFVSDVSKYGLGKLILMPYFN